jgi:ferrous-iron efflux pump FieF
MTVEADRMARVADGAERSEVARLMRLASYASVATAAVLIVGKTIAFFMTDAVSVLSTLLDSLLDVAASVVNLYAVRHALAPADPEHRFGHGKAEPLAGLAQAAFIAGSAAFLMFEVVNRLLTPQEVQHAGVGIVVMVISILLTALLVFFQRHVIRRTRSIAIHADSMHYVGDVLVNGSVIVALIVTTQFGWRFADPAIGAVISAYILYMAWRIGQHSLDMLMDKELETSDRQKIRAIALANPKVTSLHDLRTRSSGRHTFIQLHLEMDGDMSLAQAHEIADTVEKQVMQAFPEAEVLIHQDPAGLEEPPPPIGHDGRRPSR